MMTFGGWTSKFQASIEASGSYICKKRRCRSRAHSWC